MNARVIAGGACIYFAAAGCAYYYLRTRPQLPSPAQLPGGAPSGTAFDRLASVYDDTVGNEERYMGYGLMRWWLLRNAKGDVLEISAGTGRNLPHYQLQDIRSLTLSDISPSMLAVAEGKYFDQLQLGYKYPEVKPRFLLSNAEHMVAAAAQPAREVSLQDRKRQQRQQLLRGGAVGTTAAARVADSEQPQQQQQQQRQQQQEHLLEAGSPFRSIWRSKQGSPAYQPAPRAPPTGGAIGADGGASEAAETTTTSSSSSSTSAKGASASDTLGRSSSSSNSSSSSSGADSTSSSSSSSGQHSGPERKRPWGPWRCPCGRSGHHHHHDEQQPAAAAAGAAAGGSGGGPVELSSFAPHSYDVVVDTFGLCSCEDPVKVLQQAAQLVKPGGQLLLLEHGRSSWSWLEEKMASAAQAHYDKWGCWWNRDILDVVHKAGLRVVSSTRWHFGTSYMIVAEPVPPASG